MIYYAGYAVLKRKTRVTCFHVKLYVMEALLKMATYLPMRICTVRILWMLKLLEEYLYQLFKTTMCTDNSGAADNNGATNIGSCNLLSDLDWIYIYIYQWKSLKWFCHLSMCLWSLRGGLRSPNGEQPPIHEKTRTTIVVSNGRYTFNQIHFIKHNLSNIFYQIPIIQYLLSNTIYPIPFIKYFY